jgi:putative ABC transport system ATP-binding protein
VLSISPLSIEAGSRVAVTGASGSGKSTLVNILTGLERCAARAPSVGADTDIAALSERSRDRWRVRISALSCRISIFSRV